jgi:hypothetical protein
MTTLADAKRLAAPLLARNPDLAMVGRTVFIKPVTHVMRALQLEHSVFGADSFNLHWFAFFMFEPRRWLHFAWGDDFLGHWDRTDPALPRRLVDEMEARILPIFRPLHTIADVVSFANSDQIPDNQHLAFRKDSVFLVNVALGRLDEARAECGSLRKWAIFEAKQDRRQNMKVIRIALELVPLVEADDREGIVRLLWEWETAFIKTRKLEKYWVKEPFPLEEQNGLTVWKEM